MDHDDASVTSQPTDPSGDALPRDRQRQALRDLVRLATESASAEAAIEAEYAAAIRDADEKHERALWSLDQRAETQRSQWLDKHAERVAFAQDQYDQKLKAVRLADRQARQKIGVDHQTSTGEAKAKLDQGVWLADSVLEATQNQLRAESRKAAEELETRGNAIGEIVRASAGTLHTFGQPELIEQPVEASLDGVEGASVEILDRELQQARSQNASLESLPLARLFVGAWPFLAVMLLVGAAGVGAHFYRGGGPEPDVRAIAIASGAALVLALVLGLVLRVVARRQVRDAYRPLARSLEMARLASQRRSDEQAAERQQRLDDATLKREEEVLSIRQRVAPLMNKANTRRDDLVRAADTDLAAKLAELESTLEKGRLEADDWQKRHEEELAARLVKLREEQEQKHAEQREAAKHRHGQRRMELEQRLAEGLQRTEAPTASRYHTGTASPRDWSDPAWADWQPTRQFAPSVSLGELSVDLRAIADAVPRSGASTIQLPPPFKVPVVLAFPKQASLLVKTDRSQRPRAIELLQMAMVRLLTSLPPGRVKFTLVDPVGLGQNFAGFMHLADYDESLVGGRIWTDSEQIQQKLENLTDHMETVIQKYLRNEFETIDDYNAQAGELAEPYRFLVIADFPVGFTEDACRRLASIAASGARCGVYTLIAIDSRQPLPQGTHLEDLEHHGLVLAQQGDSLAWRDEVFGAFPLSLDRAPDEAFLTRVLHAVGRGAKEANRVEVPFESIAPRDEEFWTRSTRDEFSVPVGRMGATRLQSLRLGRGVAQHVLIAGKTGSGKSTLLNAIVTNSAMWFSPEEIEFYLVDFKKGVEFKAYATQELPHARAIAVESDREFGLSVLQRLDAELTRRGDLFRRAGVQDLASYRQSGGALTMPRTLLVIDEFQEFFSEDDKLAQDAALLLDRLVRQGRAFGVHVLLGSQTIGGSSGLGRATLGQMAVRIALQTSEADSQIILGDANTAARLLTRPGEAIYNDAGGLVEANSPFQIAWLPDEARERFLAKVRDRVDGKPLPFEPAAVFEGNAPADLTRSRRFAELLQQPAPTSPPTALLAMLGDPVAIKDPTSAVFRRQSGSNLLVIGQQDEQALAVLGTSLVSLATQLPRDGAAVYLLDGLPSDSPLFGQLQQVAAKLPLDVRPIDYRAVPEAMTELADELARRSEADHHDHPPIFVVIASLQRYRQLRKGDDDFSFSMSSEEKPASAGKQFADLLREGPNVGIHVLAWVDTQASIDRTLDRGSVREFDQRVLFQMSANDSSTLIDSPAANKLGFFRAIAYSEEQGVMEKFRPYALPDAGWLEGVAARLRSR
jgi:hypothetical protein